MKHETVKAAVSSHRHPTPNDIRYHAHKALLRAFPAGDTAYFTRAREAVDAAIQDAVNEHEPLYQAYQERMGE